jgi:hypothetical protein
LGRLSGTTLPYIYKLKRNFVIFSLSGESGELGSVIRLLEELVLETKNTQDKLGEIYNKRYHIESDTSGFTTSWWKKEKESYNQESSECNL